MAFGAAVAGAAVLAGSVAGSAVGGGLYALPGEGSLAEPPVDTVEGSGAVAGSLGPVTLGATAAEPDAQPVRSVDSAPAQPVAAPLPISPPPLGERARPLNTGPVTLAASAANDPEASARSGPATPPRETSLTETPPPETLTAPAAAEPTDPEDADLIGESDSDDQEVAAGSPPEEDSTSGSNDPGTENGATDTEPTNNDVADEEVDQTGSNGTAEDSRVRADNTDDREPTNNSPAQTAVFPS